MTLIKKENAEGSIQKVKAEAPRTVNVSNEGSLLTALEIKARQKAQAMLDEAFAQSQKIRDEAKKVKENIDKEVEEACQKGFEEGCEEGKASVTELLIQVKEEKEEFLKKVEKDVLNLVYDIAEKIIGKELADRDGAVVDLVRQALHSTMGKEIVLLVNPQDFEVVKKSQPQLLQSLDGLKTLQIRADEKVTRHGCIVESEIGTLDAQLEVQLQAVKRALEIDK